uniref:Pfam-B_14132 domain containing protein n=1 Tax=Echinococcus granulosus TaxID=6210 RepID=A0A068WRM3_ECHGR|nr:Pfam-B_14132 domain containing protein [Echinococcus granulosus]
MCQWCVLGDCLCGGCKIKLGAVAGRTDEGFVVVDDDDDDDDGDDGRGRGRGRGRRHRRRRRALSCTLMSCAVL